MLTKCVIESISVASGIVHFCANITKKEGFVEEKIKCYSNTVGPLKLYQIGGGKFIVNLGEKKIVDIMFTDIDYNIIHLSITDKIIIFLKLRKKIIEEVCSGAYTEYFFS